MECNGLTRTLLLAILAVSNVDPAVLHFSVIVSSAGDFNSSGSLPAVDLALEMLRNRSVLPKEFSLAYSMQNSECDQVGSLNAFFSEVLHSNVTKVGIIGCGCSVATEPVALINSNWNIPLISPEPLEVPSPVGRPYPNLFQLLPSHSNFVSAFVTLTSQFSWKRVYIITQDENLFISISRSLGLGLLQSHVQWTENRITQTENLSSIQNLFGNNVDDFRIFFLNMYSNLARNVLCEASKRGLTYPRYGWIINGDYIDGWWKQSVSDTNTSCSDGAISDVLDRALAIQLHPVAPFNHTTDVGLTTEQFFSRYQAAFSSYCYSYVSALTYDAVWTLALALNVSTNLIKSGNDFGCENETGDLVAWDNFTYSNSKMGCIMRRTLQGVKFNGVSGPVEFNPDGTRSYNIVTVLQYKKGPAGVSAENIAYIVGGNLSYSNGFDVITVYPIIVPPDGTVINITNGFSIWITAVYYAWSSIGVILSVTFGVFNLVFRERKVIKLTSPNLNYFLIAGVLITFLSTYVRLYPDISKHYVTIRCSLQNWLNAIGYSLAFGTILAKMFRVYYIFNNPSPRKKALSDFHLMLMVLGVVGVCLILLIIGEAVPAFRPAVMLLLDDETSSDTNMYGVRQDYLVWQCYTSSSSVSYFSVTIIYVYLALLQVFALILAIKTRKVKIKTLNDSKYVAALIYISSITLAVLALLTFAFGVYLNLTAAVYNGGILFVTTLFLLLLFVPKMYWLYKDPNGENVFTQNYSSTTNNESPTKAEMVTIEQLQCEVKQLQSKLKELEHRSHGAQDGSDGVELIQHTVTADNGCNRTNFNSERKSDPVSNSSSEFLQSPVLQINSDTDRPVSSNE